MSWSSRERVAAAFQHRLPDRTPVFEYLLHNPCAELLLGRPFVDYTDDPRAWRETCRSESIETALPTYCRDRLDLAWKLGHDLLFVCPNPVDDETAGYDPLLGVHTLFDLEGSDPVERVRERNRRVESELLRPPPEECLLVFHLLREEMDRRGIDLPLFAPAYFHGVWDDIDLLQVMILDPDVAHRHFSLATQRALPIVHAYAQLGVDMIGIGGDFAGKRMIISPEAYREFIVPEVRALADVVRSAGAFSINATDGNIWPVLEDFLCGCGVDGYMEIDYSAGMEMGELKSRYGDQVVLFGNMDCGNTLSFSSPEEIGTLTKEILDGGFGDGGHIFCASNAITGSIELENYLAMVNAYRDYFGLSHVQV